MEKKVSDLIFRFADGFVEPWEFDDFISIPQVGELEIFRRELIRLPDVYPPHGKRNYCNEAGLRRLREIAQELQSLGM